MADSNIAPDVYEWQVEHIRQGLREAEAGEFVPDEVRKVIARLTGTSER